MTTKKPTTKEVVFNPNIWEADPGRSLKFKAGLVYRASSRAARDTQRNTALETNKQKDYG